MGERDELAKRVGDTAGKVLGEHLERVKAAMRACIDPEFPIGWGPGSLEVYDFGFGEKLAWTFRDCAYPLPSVALVADHGTDAVLEFNTSEASWRILSPRGELASGIQPLPPEMN